MNNFEKNNPNLTRKERRELQREEKKQLDKDKKNVDKSEKSSIYKRIILAGLAAFGVGVGVNKFEGEKIDAETQKIAELLQTKQEKEVDLKGIEQCIFKLPKELGAVLEKNIFPESDVLVVYVEQKHNLNIESKEEQDRKSKEGYDYWKNVLPGIKDPIQRKKIQGLLHAIEWDQKREERVFKIQTNIYEILLYLYNIGLEVIGSEGHNADNDEDLVYKKGGREDIQAHCTKTSNPIKCQADSAIKLVKNYGADQVLAAQYTDNILPVGLEDGRYHQVLLDNASQKDSLYSSSEDKPELWEGRWRAVANNIVEKIRKNHKKFGAIQFGRGDKEGIIRYLNEMKISNIVIEPLELTKDDLVEKEIDREIDREHPL